MIVVAAAGAAARRAGTPSTGWLAARPAAPPRRPRPRPDDIGFWLYSSGSTGRPKGTVHTHANPYWTAQSARRAAPRPAPRTTSLFSAAKLFFAYGLGNALTFPLSVGATTILMAERPTPDAVFKRWIERRPTVFFGAPTGYAGMLAAPNAARALAGRAAAVLVGRRGAAARDRRALHRATSAATIVDGIGSTEMLHIFLSNRPDDIRYGTTGTPVDGYEVELRGEDGRPVGDRRGRRPLRQRADRGAHVLGPTARSRATTFQGAWTRSGDKYVRDADGYYTYCGRSDDMLKVTGQYVSPFEVEATLVQHPRCSRRR